MADNINAPRGCRPVANFTGGGEYIRTCSHPAADSVAIGKWDPVTPTGAANVVEQWDQGDSLWGIALNYVPLSVLGNVNVMITNEQSILETQEDSVGGAIAAASEGLNAALVVAAANTTTGLSQVMINSSDVGTTSTTNVDVKLLQPSTRVGNVVANNYCLWLVSPIHTWIADNTVGL